MGILKRELSEIARKQYDLVVVGGGIFGACAAWHAVARGLSVVLLEKKDFAHGTSANSLKMIHGGIRYLQHADLPRIRCAVKERRALLRMAPHLTHPLPIAIPIYGHGFKGKELLWAGSQLYDLLALDRNQGIRDPERRIPRGRLISGPEALKLFPGLDAKNLTGAAIIHDGQMYNPTRLALSFLRSAVHAGLDTANYAEVTGFLKNEGRLSGVRCRDLLTGNDLEVQGRIVLNAAGPWVEELLDTRLGLRLDPPGSYSRDVCFIVPRRLTGEYAVAVQARTKDPDAILSGGNRHLFLVPWRRYTLIGVWHKVYRGSPEDFEVTDRELLGYLDEVNGAYPGLDLTMDDISMWNAGLVLFGENDPGATDLRYAKKSRIVDHAKEHGVEGIVTVLGARYSTAKCDASKAIDMVLKKLKRHSPTTGMQALPVHGGDLESFSDFSREERKRHSHDLSEGILTALLRNYGTEYTRVLRFLDEDASLAEPIGNSNVIKAEVVHAVREEMAQRLGDVVFRRTELGTGEHPGEPALETCAALMAAEHGWDRMRRKAELQDVRNTFSRICIHRHEQFHMDSQT